MELFEQIRRAHEREGLSIRTLAERFAVHGRTVRQAIADATPPARKTPEGRPAPKLGPYLATIDGWLAADAEAPPKQRHTARRVHERLVDEHGARVSERQVRRYVRQRRRALGEPVAEVTIPQVPAPGAEAEVDWGEATVRIAGEGVDVYILSPAGELLGRRLSMAFERQTQQAFLEGHVEAFAFFGGSFALIRCDNLTAAVKKVLRGRRRLEQERFIALRFRHFYESSRASPAPARGAPMRRAGSRARSAGSAAG